MKKLKGNKKGFTLIEMIVVIVIIAILAAIAVPAIMKYIDDAKETKLVAQGHSAMVTSQATLTKAEGKSANGFFTESDVDKAIKDAQDDNDTVDKIEVCTNNINEDANGNNIANCDKPIYTQPGSNAQVNNIKTYIITFKNGKKAYVPVGNDGAVFIK